MQGLRFRGSTQHAASGRGESLRKHQRRKERTQENSRELQEPNKQPDNYEIQPLGLQDEILVA